jgi:Endonuclease NucS
LLGRLFGALDELSKQLGVKVTKFEKSALSDSQMDGIVERIRSIKPQSRGSVVASGGDVLPISRTKKLNLKNTPVLLVLEKILPDQAPVPKYVFPCKLGEKYYGLVEGIDFLKQNSTAEKLPELSSITEEEISGKIMGDPSLLEDGLKLEKAEFDTATGKADLLFVDSRGEFLIIEVEREATDSAVGQILRLAAGWEKSENLPSRSVRTGIVCLRANENVLSASSRAGIEVWRCFFGGQTSAEAFSVRKLVDRP